MALLAVVASHGDGEPPENSDDHGSDDEAHRRQSANAHPRARPTSG